MAKRRLTHQQVRRIQSAREDCRNKAEARYRQQQPQDQVRAEPEKRGLVVANHGHFLYVEAENRDLHRCVARGNLDPAVTGDRVYWQPTQSGEGVIVAIESRRSILVRPGFGGKTKPLAANVSLLVVVVAPAPPISESLVDRYLVAAEAMSANACIVLNKCDLLPPELRQSYADRLGPYTKIGYRVFTLSAHTGAGVSALCESLRGHVAILLGQSGVGKSSLVRALAPEDDVSVGKLSDISGLGTHTTTRAALYHLGSGGDLIDSPGVRSFEPAIDPSQIEPGFREIAALADNCRFNDCSHQQEPDCAVRIGVEDGRIDERRFRSLLQLRESLASRPRPTEHR